MKFYDAHIHLDQYQDHEIETFFTYPSLKGVIAVSMDLPSSQRTLDLKRRYPDRVIAACGFHPEQKLTDLSPLLEWMHNHQAEIDLIGEIGLPYYQKLYTDEQAIKQLRPFLALAAEWDKPVALHAIYEHTRIVVDLLQEYGIQKAQFHWLKTDKVTLQTMGEQGYYISFTPDILYEPDIQQIALQYPIEQIMVETDGPWSFEDRFQGLRTSPLWVEHVIRKLAELHQLPTKQMAEQVLLNTQRFLSI
ncbi:TatD DNase family protein [Seinonella peptonophila]|uniref:TatD DNase family protein n=1 Tax=Seinonella peptonophila TaxID=112248 RepID=A0A1M4YDF2_9BACL|nr:TatD family hydrolase [Seinonella peptonophila]SHF03780.1 TatD DNase family protein [Seinonella peptonophila]